MITSLLGEEDSNYLSDTKWSAVKTYNQVKLYILSMLYLLIYKQLMKMENMNCKKERVNVWNGLHNEGRERMAKLYYEIKK